MTPDEAIAQAKRIMASMSATRNNKGMTAEAQELIRLYAGEKSSFFKAISNITAFTAETYVDTVREILSSFISSIEGGIIGGMSPERKARIDVVSDLLEQTVSLLNLPGIHPAAPTVLAGAALEEFLRNWVEDAGLTLGTKKPSLDSYSSVLREADLIAKQDSKDIASWAGLRNHAAHGDWDDVSDKKRIQIMIEGINLFMRKHTN